jgi:hypothetical protein
MVSLAVSPPPKLFHFRGPMIFQYVFPPLELAHLALFLSRHPSLIPLYLLDYHK